MAGTVYDYFERLANLMDASSREEAARHGLKRIQLRVLHFLARANRYSNTSKAVAEYFGLTKGTISQTLQTLATKNLVSRQADPSDGRVVRLFLTEAGASVVEETFPLQVVRDDPPLARQLDAVLRDLQRQNHHRSFGECRTCRFHRVEAPGQARCGLTGERLSVVDARHICLEHEWPAP